MIQLHIHQKEEDCGGFKALPQSLGYHSHEDVESNFLFFEWRYNEVEVIPHEFWDQVLKGSATSTLLSWDISSYTPETIHWGVIWMFWDSF